MMLHKVSYEIAAVLAKDASLTVEPETSCQAPLSRSKQTRKGFLALSAIFNLRYSHLLIFAGQLIIRCLQ
jgi:hypothetical protein